MRNRVSKTENRETETETERQGFFILLLLLCAQAFMASLNDFRVPLTAFLVVFLSFLCAFPHELFLLFQAFLFKLLDRLLSGLAFLLCASAAIAAFSIINSRQKYMVGEWDRKLSRHYAQFQQNCFLLHNNFIRIVSSP